MTCEQQVVIYFYELNLFVQSNSNFARANLHLPNKNCNGTDRTIFDGMKELFNDDFYFLAFETCFEMCHCFICELLHTNLRNVMIEYTKFTTAFNFFSCA